MHALRLMALEAALPPRPSSCKTTAMPSRDKLAEFTAWCMKHVTGDEKGDAQLFLDRLFHAFGHAGLKEAGATLEFRVIKAAEAGGATSFADLVWKPVVLIEMKRRGENLQRHYRQAFDYWTRLVPTHRQQHDSPPFFRRAVHPRRVPVAVG